MDSYEGILQDPLQGRCLFKATTILPTGHSECTSTHEELSQLSTVDGRLSVCGDWSPVLVLCRPLYSLFTLRIDTSGWGVHSVALFHKVWISCFLRL